MQQVEQVALPTWRIRRTSQPTLGDRSKSALSLPSRTARSPYAPHNTNTMASAAVRTRSTTDMHSSPNAVTCDPAPLLHSSSPACDRQKRHLKLVELHSTSIEDSSALEKTLLKSRLDLARARLVKWQDCEPARLLNAEEAERLKREEEEDMLSTPSSGCGGMASQSVPPSVGSGDRAVHRVAEVTRRSECKSTKDASALTAALAHTPEIAVSSLADQDESAWVDASCEGDNTTLGTSPPRFALYSPPQSTSHAVESLRSNLQVRGFRPQPAAVNDDNAVEYLSPSMVGHPRAPPPSPATPAGLSSLLSSRPSEEAGFALSLAATIENDREETLTRPIPRLELHDTHRIPRKPAPSVSPQPVPTASARPLTPNTLSSSRTPHSSLPFSHPDRPARSSPPLPAPSEACSSGDSSSRSLCLSFARRPTMTRQGSMGESFGKLYEDDKAAKRDKAMKLMEMKGRGGLAGIASTRRARGFSSGSGSVRSETTASVRSVRSIEDALGLECTESETAKEGSLYEEADSYSDAFGEWTEA